MDSRRGKAARAELPLDATARLTKRLAASYEAERHRAHAGIGY
jgi:hypothetical protein